MLSMRDCCSCDSKGADLLCGARSTNNTIGMHYYTDEMFREASKRVIAKVGTHRGDARPLENFASADIVEVLNARTGEDR